MKLRHFALALILASFLSSCAGPGFNKKWEAALAEHPAPHTEITGPWQGSWESDANGHSGKLKAIVDEAGEDTYNFQYWATWGRVMSGTFELESTGETSGGVTRVTGQKKLGPFGRYNHEAEITPNAFKAKFSSDKKNLGNFELSRP